MNQNYSPNNDYEILTPDGWKDFTGVIFNQNANKSGAKLYFDNGTSIIATDDHRFFIAGEEIAVKKLKIGDYLESISGRNTITAIDKSTLLDTYDIFNADGHVIYANAIATHNCDEFSHVRPTIAKEFYTSIMPTLATGGDMIITSTPNTDDDQFWEIWVGANKTIDEFGNKTNLGVNGFKAFKALWNEHPDRDEKWAIAERARIGENKFLLEYQCCAGNTNIDLLNNDGTKFSMSMVEYFNSIKL